MELRFPDASGAMMIDVWQFVMPLQFVTEFTVTQDHLKLLRQCLGG